MEKSIDLFILLIEIQGFIANCILFVWILLHTTKEEYGRISFRFIKLKLKPYALIYLSLLFFWIWDIFNISPFDITKYCIEFYLSLLKRLIYMLLS